MIYETDISSYPRIECFRVEPLEIGDLIMVNQRDCSGYCLFAPFIVKFISDNKLYLEPLDLIPCRKID